MSEQDPSYIPLFELGIINTPPTTPVVKVLGKFKVDPLLLSFLLTALCDYNIDNAEESAQATYEEDLYKHFFSLMPQRFDLNVTKKQHTS